MKIKKVSQSAGIIAEIEQNLDSNSEVNAPSVKAVKNAIEKSYILATLNEDIWGYEGQILEPIPLDKVVYKKGEKFTLENNKIKIGSGVSKIKVSSAIFLNDFIGTGYAWGKIMKNGTGVATALQPTITGAAPYVSVCIPSTIIDVEEGDLINLRIEQTTRQQTSIRAGKQYTFLFVEEYY